MNKRLLIKQFGLKSTLFIRDYYSTILRTDYDKKLFKEVEGHCDTEEGDVVYIFTIGHKKSKKHVGDKKRNL